MKVKRIIYAILLTFVLYGTWVGTSRLISYFVKNEWIDVSFTFISLFVVLAIALKIADKIDKRIINK